MFRLQPRENKYIDEQGTSKLRGSPILVQTKEELEDV